MMILPKFIIYHWEVIKMKKLKHKKFKRKKWATEDQSEKKAEKMMKNALKPYKAKKGPYKTK